MTFPDPCLHHFLSKNTRFEDFEISGKLHFYFSFAYCACFHLEIVLEDFTLTTVSVFLIRCYPCRWGRRVRGFKHDAVQQLDTKSEFQNEPVKFLILLPPTPADVIMCTQFQHETVYLHIRIINVSWFLAFVFMIL